MRLPWWLYAIGAVIAVVLGWRLKHERELDQARKRAEEWRRKAYEAGNAQAIAQAEAEIARIDRDLAAARGRDLVERVRAAVDEARRRRAGGSAE